MSEPEKKFDSKTWMHNIEESVKALDQKLDRLSIPPLNLSSASNPEPPKEHKDHWKAEDMLKTDCPNCKAEIEKIGKQHMAKVLFERADYPFECVGCGLHVRKDEEKCPNCGTTEARGR